MLSKPINFRAWGIFSLFVWLHITPAIYPFPWQQYDEIYLDSITAAKNESMLDPNDPENRTPEKWEQGLIVSTWSRWLVSTFYLSFGLLFTWLLFTNSQWWPVLMCGLAVIALYHTLPNLYGLATINGSYSESLSPWGRLISKWLREGEFLQLLKAYSIWIWPLYGIILLWLSIRSMWHRKQKHEPVA